MAECELLVRVTGYGFCAGLVTNGDNRIVMCAPILRKHVQFNNANLSAFLADGQRKGWTFDYVEPMQAPEAGLASGNLP